MKKLVSFWLMPLSFCVAALVAGLLLMRSTRWARLGRALVLATVVLLVVLSHSWVSKQLLRPLETRYPAQPELAAGAPVPAPLAACKFVVVLGGGNGFSPGVSANNLLAPASLSRLVEGVRLLRALPDAKLIVSGPGDGRLPTHASVQARAAEALGVPPSRILLIDQARDTEDEARETRRLAGGAPVAVVTSAWHLPRAIALFQHEGLTPLPCPADFRAHAEYPFGIETYLWDADGLVNSSLALRERIGYLWIWLRGRAR